MFMATSKSFHCKDLPKFLVDYRSNESKIRLVRSLSKGTAVPFLSLSSCFNTQSEPTFCGLSTLAIILNSLRIDPQRWFSEDILDCCRPSLEDVKKVGITMEEFQCLAACNGALCRLVRPKDNEEDFKMFAKALFSACTGGKNWNCEEKYYNCYDRENGMCGSMDFDEEDPNTYMAVSYSREVLNQTGKGHYSPVAAYDEESNSALILDTARFKYPPYWVPLKILFQSMLPLDDTTGKSRGYFLISARNKFHDGCAVFGKSYMLYSERKNLTQCTG